MRTASAIFFYPADGIRSVNKGSLWVAEKVVISVIPSDARNLSGGCVGKKKEKFLASLGMKESRGNFFRSLRV
jgi:hypothetical protein